MSTLAWLAHELGRPEAWDEGIEAARNACVGGASLAAAAITAAAYYDNPLTGLPALRACLELVGPPPLELDAWCRMLAPRPHPDADGQGMTPGFGFVAPGQQGVFIGALARWAERAPNAPRARFLLAHEAVLVRVAGPLNAAGLSALVCADEGFDASAAERLFLLSKLASALEQGQKARRAGLGTIPFNGVRYVYEGELPPARGRDRHALLRQLGLDEDERG